jgi:cellobiose dehydrogenase (acceptor)
LTADKQVEVVFPAKNTTIDQHLENYAQTTGGRSGNHWMGSCKMGTDSGLENGTAVVDTNTKVYGMENLFVVDASIFPEMITTNPSALIVSVAEHASEKILALESTSSAGNTTVVPEVAPVASNTTVSAKPTVPLSTGLPTIESSAPASNNTEVAAPTATTVAEPVTSAAAATSAAQATSSAASSAAAPSASSESSSSTAQAEWATCGGNSDYKGSTTCAEGLTCKKWNDYYSQCIKA